MIKLIIKDLSKKLSKYIDEKNGSILITSDWVNNWLNENDGAFTVEIIDAHGVVKNDCKVRISNKK